MGWNRREIGWGTTVNNTWDWYRSLPTTTTTTSTTSTTSTTTTSTTTTSTTTTTAPPSSGWSLFGATSAGPDTQGPPSLVSLSTDLIVVGNGSGADSKGYLRAYQWNGTAWVQVGNSYYTGLTTVLALAKISSTRVLAVINNAGVDATHRVLMYDWDGTNFTPYGTAWNTTYANWAGVTLITSTTAVYTTDNGDISYITESGGLWSLSSSTTGASLFLNTNAPRVAYMGTGTRVAYVSGTNIACLELVGPNWVVVGSILTTLGAALPCITSYSTNNITWVDASFGSAQIRKYFFNGTNWILQTGSTAYTQAGIPAVTMFESNKAVVCNNDTDNLINYQYT